MENYELSPYSKSAGPSSVTSFPDSSRAFYPGLGQSGDSEWRSGEHILQNDLHLNETTERTSPSAAGKSDVNGEGNQKPVTGFKLFSILASVTMAAFLMLLDGSIIGVVGTWR